MTPEQINIAIAESVGLKVQDVPFTPAFLDLSRVYLTERAFNLYRKTFPSCSIPMRVPDYHSDKNAMQEVLLQLGFDWYTFTLVFWDLIGHARLPEKHLYWLFATATAHQLAEAYLRTIGKWKE